MAKKPAGTPALELLAKVGVPFTVHEYEHVAKDHFGDETVAALGSRRSVSSRRCWPASREA